MRRVLLCLVVVASVVLINVPSAAAATADVWSSEYGGAGNASYNPGEHLLTAENASRLTQVWSRSEAIRTFVAPAIVNGVVYQVANTSTVAPSTFEAIDAQTGRTKWSIKLPWREKYLRGQSVEGQLVVLPFEGFQRPGGVTVIDLRTHKIVWTRAQPLPRNSAFGTDRGTAGPVLVDADRVYMYEASNSVNVFRLSDGANVWQLPMTTVPFRGAALGAGVLYAGGNGGVTAYVAATGRKLWTAPGWGMPVVAGGRVFSPTPGGIVADAADGCGAPTCPALWTRQFGSVADDIVAIGGASATTLFVSYTLESSHFSGVLKRLSGASGETQWTAYPGAFPGIPVRAGDTVWTVTNAETLNGYSAISPSTSRLVQIAEPSIATPSVVQGAAIADGMLIIEIWPGYLIGYRVPQS